MEQGNFADQVAGVAALDHPVSRDVYAFVVASGWATRDETAEAIGVPRSVAAFHLEKLHNAGLLATRFERVSGRTGPGAGRPAKLYGRAERQFDITLPARHYELAGDVLAEAVNRASATGAPVIDTLSAVARDAGVSIGSERRKRQSRRKGRALLVAALRRQGYEPHDGNDSIRLVNCPFHELASKHRELVCGMNLHLLDGVIEGAQLRSTFEAKLAPEAGYCCVRIDCR